MAEKSVDDLKREQEELDETLVSLEKRADVLESEFKRISTLLQGKIVLTPDSYSVEEQSAVDDDSHYNDGDGDDIAPAASTTKEDEMATVKREVIEVEILGYTEAPHG